METSSDTVATVVHDINSKRFDAELNIAGLFGLRRFRKGGDHGPERLLVQRHAGGLDSDQ